MAKKKSDPTRLNPFQKGEKDVINAVIETPMGSRNKFKYDEDLGCYSLSSVLPQGMMFPHAFGFIPQTRAADGDPEDVLVIIDEPVFPGCIVPSRLLGVIEAEQTEEGKTERNDRLIAISTSTREMSDVSSLRDLNQTVMKEIEQFFITYNKERGKKFKVLGRRGPQQAMKLLKKSLKRAA